MGNCLSKGETSTTTPNVPREKPVTQDVSEKTVAAPKQSSEPSTVEPQKEKAEAIEKKDEAAPRPVVLERTSSLPQNRTAQNGLQKQDSGKDLSAKKSQDEATPALDDAGVDKEQSTSATEPAVTTTEAPAEPKSTETPVATEDVPATPSSPITDFDFGLATRSLVNGDEQAKPTEAAKDTSAESKDTATEAPKETKTTPPLTHLVTTLPPSTDHEEFKTATSHPSTVSPTVASPNDTITATETKQTSPPTSALPRESQDDSKKTESKFNEVTEDPSELKVGATAANTQPPKRSSTAPQVATPVSPATDKSKRQSRISRMFTTSSKRQSRKISPNPPRREPLPAVPKSPLLEKPDPIEPPKEIARPETANSADSGLISPNLEGRKYKDDGDNDSLFCY